MFDQGPHVVLRRDGVCLVLKTPEGEMPQVEYWGGISALRPMNPRSTSLTR